MCQVEVKIAESEIPLESQNHPPFNIFTELDNIYSNHTEDGNGRVIL